MTPIIKRIRSIGGNAWRWCALPPKAKAEGWHDRLTGLGNDHGINRCVDEALGWLLRAQDHSRSADGGVARHFSLVDGWSTSYPETTGYIVPTLLAMGRRLHRDELRARAARMLDWLVSIQLPDGAFQGGCIGVEPVQPAVFDTGQILLGLAAGVEEFGEDRYKQSLHRAAGWLLDCQARDGSWPQKISPCALPGPKAYETHVAWGLLEAGRVLGNTAYVDAALGNVRWAIGHQHANGWFEKCCLTNPAQPLTHTLGYALRGVLEAYQVTRAGQYLDSAERTARGLLSAVQADGGIPGRLNSQWRHAVRWVCLTGNVQIAICWFMLHQVTEKGEYLHAAKLANAFVRRTVRTTGPEGQRGGVKGAFPVTGEYGRYQYLNWAAKFFIDANVLESDLTGSPQAPDSGKPNGA